MFDVGERISIRNKSSDEVSLGTIRFVGSLSGKEGTWVGVEWDDPHRGKHDGSFDGIRYFQCQYEPASASFLNANKVHRGSTLTDAFRERYQRRDNDLKDMTIETSGHRHMAVTLRGEESIHKRMSDLQSLQSATMHCADISIPVCSCVGEPFLCYVLHPGSRGGSARRQSMQNAVFFYRGVLGRCKQFYQTYSTLGFQTTYFGLGSMCMRW